jgi:hypothetical protein
MPVSNRPVMGLDTYRSAKVDRGAASGVAQASTGIIGRTGARRSRPNLANAFI